MSVLNESIMFPLVEHFVPDTKTESQTNKLEKVKKPMFPYYITQLPQLGSTRYAYGGQWDYEEEYFSQQYRRQERGRIKQRWVVYVDDLRSGWISRHERWQENSEVVKMVPQSEESE